MININNINAICLFSFLLFACHERANNQKKLPLDDFNHLIAEKIDNLTKENNQTILRDQRTYFGNDTVHYHMLSEYITQNILFFYFSENTCNPCIEQSIEYISQFIPDYSNNSKVIFLSPDYMPRFRDNCYGKRLLGLENKKMGISVEEENIPFFFTLSEDLRISNLHIVNKNDFAKTATYLKNIQSNLK